jgi:hypothetical protein
MSLYPSRTERLPLILSPGLLVIATRLTTQLPPATACLGNREQVKTSSWLGGPETAPAR